MKKVHSVLEQFLSPDNSVMTAIKREEFRGTNDDAVVSPGGERFHQCMVVRRRPFSVTPAAQRAFAVDGSLALAASPKIHAPVHPKRFGVLTGGLHQSTATAPKERSLLIAADALKTVNLILKRTPFLFHGERYDNNAGMY